MKETAAYNRDATRTADAYDDFVGSNAEADGRDLARWQDLVNKVRTEYYAPAAEDVPVQRVLEKQSDGTWRNRIKIKGDTGSVESVQSSDGTWKIKTSDSGQPGRPVGISPEVTDQLNGYQNHISDILKQKSGNYRLDEGPVGSRRVSASRGSTGALENLRALQADVQGRYSLGSKLLHDLPVTPLR